MQSLLRLLMSRENFKGGRFLNSFINGPSSLFKMHKKIVSNIIFETMDWTGVQ